MSESGQVVQRAVAFMRRRETIRIAAPVAGAVVVIGVLLGVFLPGGPESDGSSGQTVDIAERAAESAADEATADTPDASEATAAAGAAPDETAEGAAGAGDRQQAAAEAAGDDTAAADAAGAGSAAGDETSHDSVAAQEDTAGDTETAAASDAMAATDVGDAAEAAAGATAGTAAQAADDAATGEQDDAAQDVAEAGEPVSGDAGGGAAADETGETAVAASAAGEQEMAAASTGEGVAPAAEASGDEGAAATVAASDDAETATTAQRAGEGGDDGEAAAQAAISATAEGVEPAAGAGAAEASREAGDAGAAQSRAATGTAGEPSGEDEEAITEARVTPDEAVEATPDAAGAEQTEGQSPTEEPGVAAIPPSFDTVRISPDGNGVFAGRAEPGAEVTLRSGSEEIGSVTADRRGEWVLLPDKPIAPGDHELSLVETLPDGTQVESEQVLVLSVPDPEAGGEERSTLAVLVPRDGDGSSKVLQMAEPQQPEPDADAPFDEARLAEPETGAAAADSSEPGAAATDEAGTEVAAADAAGTGDPGAAAESAAATDAVPESAAASTDAATAGEAPATGAVAEGEEPASDELAEGEGLASEDDESLVVGTVDYDDKGDMTFSGKADPDAKLNVYVDDQHVGTTESDKEGDWEVEAETETEIEPGTHTLRIDQVDEAGIVLARIETPLIRARPELLTFGDAIVVVQPGNSLWRIARRTLGGGVHFTEIYEANRSQIRDPALIYPGQIFTLPKVGGG